MRPQESPPRKSPRLIWLVTSLALAAGCGVHGPAIEPAPPTSGTAGSTLAGTAGATSTGSGAAGTTGSGTAGASSATGAAGSASGTAGGVGSGVAGSGNPGVAGGTGAGGSSGTAGTTGAAGTAPPSGLTIKIGNNVVAKEDAIAFIHIGHSNMAGRGVDLPETRPYFFGTPDPHAWMYHSGKGFEPAVEPNTAGDGGNMINGMVSGGPGTALVKEAVALAPDKYFISLGFGQSSAYCSQFLPGALYYNRLMAGPLELKGKVTFAGIMIYLGITERHGTQADIDGYPQCINKLVTQIRTDLGEPNLPMIINDYEMGATGPLAPGSAFYNAIRPKEQMVPMVVSNSALIETDDPSMPGVPCSVAKGCITIQIDHSTTDEHHFSLDGHKEYVRRLLAAMQQKGWFPWK